MSNYQAAISDVNAKQAELNADLRLEKAQIDVEDRSLQQAALLGSAEARIGASGVGFTSPSVVRTRISALDTFAEERDRIMRQGLGEAANFQTQANVFRSEAGSQRSAGSFALLESFLKAGSAISGAPQFKKTNPFTPQSGTRLPGRTYFG